MMISPSNAERVFCQQSVPERLKQLNTTLAAYFAVVQGRWRCRSTPTERENLLAE